jgi:ribosome-associated translation inhibitor RaiA
MQLNIHTHGIALSNSLREFACDRITAAVSRISSSVRKIQVNVVDCNGPNRSGADQSCRVVVHVRRQQPLVFEDRDTQFGLVIDRIADRLSEAVSRRVDRGRGRRNLSASRSTILLDA